MASRKKKSEQTLTDACQKLLTALEKELHKALKGESAPGEEGRRDELRAEWQTAKDEGRTAKTFAAWCNDLVTQIGASWVLSCVFVRFCEDNELVDRPWIAGRVDADPALDRRKRAQDTERAHYADEPSHGPREYLQHVFRTLAAQPGLDEMLDPEHALLWRLSPRIEGGRLLLEFFRELNDAGQLRWDFTDDQLDTRFLGDLYQDLSVSARKTYALLQTPDFIEEFLLDRTLEPAIETFGLKEVRMIDPTCGSGHFLLGSFRRLLDHWRRKEPGTNATELARRALDAVHGVDVNPFAVAITRFRLLVSALRSSGVAHLADAPHFPLHVAVGDSLLHGPRFAGKRGTFFEHEGEFSLGYLYEHEIPSELKAILGKQYHAVVGNPPYIRPKDKAQKSAYRERFESCYREFALSVPFMERFVELAVRGGDGKPAGYVGKITSNSFMKREFGSKLIEELFPRWDLTHVIDTSGAYIPGHGTPTVILCFRNQFPPQGSEVRAVLGIRGEPATPEDPAQGQVWSAIVSQLDRPGSESNFISVEDKPLGVFASHPWSLGGGGASALMERLESCAAKRLKEVVDVIGFVCMTRADDVYVAPPGAWARIVGRYTTPFVEGDRIRDWVISEPSEALFPYEGGPDFAPVELDDHVVIHRSLWPYRTGLYLRKEPNGDHREAALTWHEWSRFQRERYKTPLSIAFAFVATHNHFVLDRGGKVFKQSAPVIKLPPDATEDDHFALLALLNSSTECFFGKQVFHCKGEGGGSRVDAGFSAVGSEPWKNNYEWDSTKLQLFPVLSHGGTTLARTLDSLSLGLTALSPSERVRCWSDRAAVEEDERAWLSTLSKMISVQEELDWEIYAAFGLADESLCCRSSAVAPDLNLGHRAFELAMARSMRSGGSESSWFQKHRSTPVLELPDQWPRAYRELVERRIKLVEEDRDIRLLEQPEHKRRWYIEPWENQVDAALESALVERIEELSTWRADPPTPTSVARLAETLERDERFVTLLRLRSGEEAPDVERAITKLVDGDSVPFLPVLYLKTFGLQTRESWEEAWEKQRIEDPFLERQEALLREHFGSTPAEQKRARQHVACWLTTNKVTKEKALLKELRDREAERARLEELRKLEKLRAAWLAVDKERRAAIGGATPPVPTEYKKADFLGNAWSLRGKLDVPKERFIAYPHCSPDGDDTLLVGWAGWDHAQRAAALAQILQARQSDGWTGERLAPIFQGIDQLIPWLEQWHGDEHAAAYRGLLESELRQAELTLDQVRAWTPH